MNNTEIELKTLGELKNFLGSLSDEQLAMPIDIIHEDQPVAYVYSASILGEDHMYDGDWDHFGSRSDVESWIESSEVETEMDDFEIVHPAGHVLFFATHYNHNQTAPAGSGDQ